MQKCLEETRQEMQKGLKETRQEMQKRQEEMQKGVEDMQKRQEETKNELKERKDKRRPRKIELKSKLKKELKEQVEERTEGVAENFSIISQRVENLEKKILASGNTTNETKFVTASPVHVPSSAVPLTASPLSVLLPTYDEKTTGRSSARPEIPQGLRTSADENKTRETGESLQEYASEVEKARQLGFPRPPSNCARSNLFAIVRGWVEAWEIQKAVRMADVQDLKFALLYALK
ncbi:hypothetical protein TNCV_1279971 [Trichonephila clavipes]|nr:hypothetical protein TNCV_1279971 [Trichonephila clavipes]